MDNIRGAYGEVGNGDFGEPRPDMPPTDCLLFTVGRLLGIGGGMPLLNDPRLAAEFELISVGGVLPP
jgi:hypothetical protein